MHVLIIGFILIGFVSGEEATRRNRGDILQAPFRKTRAVQDEQQAVNKIVDGQAAGYGEFPWMVSLHYNGKYKCAGSIYNDGTILTSTFCVLRDNEQKDGQYTIIAGDYKRTKPDAHEQEVHVKEVVVHPKFHLSRYGYDIAVLKLTKKLNLNPYVQVLPIPPPWKEKLLLQNDVCVYAGWGWTNYPDSSNAWILRKVDAPIMDREACQTYLDTGGIPLLERQICTWLYGQGGCMNDGGAPLIAFDKSNNPFHIGILEFGDSCGGLGVHTRTTKFRTWIAGVVSKA